MPAITAALQGIAETQFVLRNTEQGLEIESTSPLPASTTLASLIALDRLAQPRVGRRAKDAEERMKKVGQALRKYYRKNQMPPDSLMQLVPGYIKKLPRDPFLVGSDFRYGICEGGSGWVLASVGPDGEPNVDVDAYHSGRWQAMMRAQDATQIALGKRLLYRFHHKRFKDERALDDEGDIVRTGGW